MRKRPDPRASAHARGYGRDWRKYRVAFLCTNTTCVLCGEPSTVVDHVRAAKGDENLFWDESNHRALCKRCHDQRVDEGDFGRSNA